MPAVRRRPAPSHVLTVALGLPAFLGGLTVMACLGVLAAPRLPWLVPALWVLSGAVLFVPSVEAHVSRVVVHLRQPGPADLTLLVPAWQSVCRAAGIDGSRYDLLVEESSQPNAFAAGGRTVGVTRAALRLPPAELEAVLAHELGHHLAVHPATSRMIWWYSLPIQAVAYLGGLLLRFALAVGRTFLVFGNWLGCLASLVVAVALLAAIAFVSFWLLLAPLVAPLVAWVRRLGEYRADRTAALLGYGQTQIQTLHRWRFEDAHDVRPAGFRGRLLSPHPSHADRIRRLEALLTHRAS